MGVYRKVCYKVEDAFVKVLARKQDPEEVREKVATYRLKKEEEKAAKKNLAKERAAEQARQREIKKERQHNDVLALLSKVVAVESLDYTKYEYDEVKANKPFFRNLINKVFEEDEQGITFLNCEFDKSSKKEIKGYLIVTNKRVWFTNKDLDFQQKFRYQTIKAVNWEKDGLLERELKIQYGVKKLEFDEIYDADQMVRVGEFIVQKSGL
ncbi:PH (Pleckstrin Homology) domain-containing protein [Scopulibacillus darangshiensis]|uniref:PH (Pleckstrin Homology) domain-containing protein n=1 Tax=Scopulibacillus darangshiensis TaxID=442528 RepID=A0A4R2NSI5_9BACL|nr:PH domain-containing protein [Scopulibacillus darangshiensis]TCP24903.1 PH (Pleckstrin Homology) domain-containing protein [Scopulibacillus darangshiensis]